jgi:hypothetical protein
MAFEKGRKKTGGRQPGTPNKATLLSQTLLEEFAMTPTQLIVETWRKAMELDDITSAAKIAGDVMKICFTPPTQTLEVTDTRVRTLADYFAAQPKDDTGEVKNERN